MASSQIACRVPTERGALCLLWFAPGRSTRLRRVQPHCTLRSRLCLTPRADGTQHLSETLHKHMPASASNSQGISLTGTRLRSPRVKRRLGFPRAGHHDRDCSSSSTWGPRYSRVRPPPRALSRSAEVHPVSKPSLTHLIESLLPRGSRSVERRPGVGSDGFPSRHNVSKVVHTSHQSSSITPNAGETSGPQNPTQNGESFSNSWRYTLGVRRNFGIRGFGAAVLANPGNREES